jgi:hypothetical protein
MERTVDSGWAPDSGSPEREAWDRALASKAFAAVEEHEVKDPVVVREEIVVLGPDPSRPEMRLRARLVAAHEPVMERVCEWTVRASRALPPKGPDPFLAGAWLGQSRSVWRVERAESDDPQALAWSAEEMAKDSVVRLPAGEARGLRPGERAWLEPREGRWEQLKSSKGGLTGRFAPKGGLAVSLARDGGLPLAERVRRRNAKLRAETDGPCLVLNIPASMSSLSLESAREQARRGTKVVHQDLEGEEHA